METILFEVIEPFIADFFPEKLKLQQFHIFKGVLRTLPNII